MKLAVVGSRDFADYQLMAQVLDRFSCTQIISGGARGADSLAERYAREKDIPLQVFPAQWHVYGRSAGFRRNRAIVDACERLVAFWDGRSRGTLHSITLATDSGKLLDVVRFR